MVLRDYQQACIDEIESRPPGRYLIQMATGLGKTATFTHIPRHGRVLILSHREELVNQPVKYYACPVGIEKGMQKSHGEEVVSASVGSMVHRLERFNHEEFDTIICDECHHAAAKTYRTIFSYFKPQKLLGFTATPGRGDKVRLDDLFEDIIFQRDLRWGIQHGYLSDIYCKRINIGYDLRGVHTVHGDYAPGELEKAMDGTADAIAQAYREHAVGATLIFAASVHQAEEISVRIPGSVVVTGNTKDRASIIKRFTDGEIPCIVNVMVFTEGTDIPRVETVIIARPTQSESLYTQMVGRGLRLYPGKERMVLIDCVGITGKASLCTAPTLIGLDMTSVPPSKRENVFGDLFDLPVRIAAASDCPESWIRNVEIVNLWAKEQNYQTHNVNWFKLPDGSLICNLPDRHTQIIPCPDELGRTVYEGKTVTMQAALDCAYLKLCTNFPQYQYIWDKKNVDRWGKQPASEKQLRLVQRKCKGFDTTGLTKAQANQILSRVLGGGRVGA